jgi:hypothetical protein
MSDMKFTRPDFPRAEVMRKLVIAVRPYTTSALDLVAICATLAAYAARYARMQQGKSLTREEWLEFCLTAYHGSRDEQAKDLLAV